MANITVSTSLSNVAVNTTSNVVNVSTTTSNITVGQTVEVANSDVRTKISVSNISGFGNLAYDSSPASNGIIQYVGVSQSDIRGSISNTAPILYDSATGVISANTDAIFSNTLANNWFTSQTTDNLTEGTTNLYYTTDRSNTAIENYISGSGNINFANGVISESLTTTDITEGDNLYYTNARVNAYVIDAGLDFNAEKVDDRVANLMVADGNLSYAYDDANGTLTLSQSLTTTDITEGDNLYYTDTRVHTAIGEVTNNGNISGNVSFDLSANIVHSANITGNITNISFTNAPSTGFSATLILIQDGTGGHVIDTLYFSNWEFTNNDSVLDTSPGDQNIITIVNDGTTTYASLVGFNADTAFNTDQVPEGSTNLYWTTDRGNTTIGAYTGNMLNINTITTSGNINGGPLYITGDSTIIGNLEVQGNIDYVNVEDLLVNDNSITLNYGNATPRDAFIYVDRSGNVSLTNAHIKWNETDDDWEFFDGTTTYNMPKSTTDLAEGTNLYFTNARVNAFIQDSITTDDITEGSNLYYTEDRVRNNMANTLVGGANITITPDLANSIITIDADLTGDITGVTAGDGLTGGGTAGDVTLDVGAGYGITANPDNVAFANSVLTTLTTNVTTTANVQGSWFIGNVSGTTADFTGNITAGNIVSNSVIDTTADITTTGNITGGYIIAGNDPANEGIFIGDLNGAILVEVYNASGNTLNKGDIVALNGDAHGSTPDVVLADSGNASLMPGFAVVKNQIQDGDVGEGVISGKMNFNSHPYTIGAQLYVDGSGTFTETRPTGEDQLVQKIATVTNANTLNIAGAGRTNDIYNVDQGKIILGSTSNVGITVTPDTNFDTTGNAFSLSNALVDINKIDSETDTAFTLYGEGGIEFNKKVDSTESRIVDITTTGYSLTEATLPADFDPGTNQPGLVVSLSTTANSTTAYALDLYGGALGANADVAAFRGPGYSSALGGGDLMVALANANVAPPFPGAANLEHVITTVGDTIFGSGQNGIYNPGAGLYGQTKGWRAYDIASATYNTLFPANTYVTGISGAAITFSEPALLTAVPRTVILFPGMAQTTANNTQLKYYVDTAPGANADYISNFGTFSNFDLPETLSNTTFDAVSYGNTTSVTMTTVGTKNISDFVGSDESATRFKRGLLVGASATPDPASSRAINNAPSTLGVILENDGETYTGTGAPAPRFLLNNYTGNLDDLTVLPTWAQLGATGNLSLDLPQVKANQLLFKAFRGAKSTEDTANYKLQAGEVVGKISWSPGQTDGTGYQGVDYINQPASITVDVGDANVTYVANTYMHITTTPDPGTNLGYMRNNANTIFGANQQTNFTTKGGNVTIAAQTNGMITLAPTPDYGDASNSTIWTRYPGSTHNYHTFLNASFSNTSAKQGTLIEIQPKSGTTTGSGGLGYNSVGDAKLRLTTHESNSVVKTYWDITNEHIGGNLQIARDGTDVIEIGDKFNFQQVAKLHKLSNTEILALTGNEQGDMVYNYTDNLVAYYDGTDWRNIAQGTIIV
jgi:hypothetical protein